MTTDIKPSELSGRFTVEWTPELLVEQAARERGFTDDDRYGRSFWDFVNDGEFIQRKSFKSKTQAFQAARSRVRISVSKEVRIAHEFYDADLNYWEERAVFYVNSGMKSIKEAA